MTSTEYILNFLLQEGYAQTSTVHNEIFPRNGIQAVRKTLRSIEHYLEWKELPMKGRGAGERAYYLSSEGLKACGKKGQEITSYQRQLGKISINKMRHFLMVRKLERSLYRDVSQTDTYSADGCNEFNEKKRVLQVKFKHQRQYINFRSDAHLQIKKAGREILTIKVEVDKGTEPISVLSKKITSYLAFTQSPLVTAHASTYPIYCLFVVNSPKRIDSIIKKLNKSEPNPFLFLLSDKIGQMDLYHEAALLDGQGKPVSLFSLVSERLPILTFKNSIEEARLKYKANYEILVKSVYTTPLDPFFPLAISFNGRSCLFEPEAYLRIRQKQSNNSSEKLFALALAVKNNDTVEEVVSKLQLYQNFLEGQEGEYRRRVSDVKHCYGVLIILDMENKKIDMLIDVLKKLKILKNIRMVKLKDCQTDQVLEKAVWLDACTNRKISIFPT